MGCVPNRTVNHADGRAGTLASRIMTVSPFGILDQVFPVPLNKETNAMVYTSFCLPLITRKNISLVFEMKAPPVCLLVVLPLM